MSSSHAYSPVLIALLAMFLLLVLPLVYGAHSFHRDMALKVLGWGMVAIVIVAWVFGA